MAFSKCWKRMPDAVDIDIHRGRKVVLLRAAHFLFGAARTRMAASTVATGTVKGLSVRAVVPLPSSIQVEILLHG